MSDNWSGRSRARIAAAVLAACTVLAVSPASADAAGAHKWTRLAACESGGRWHINTGNGYFGGLQFSRPTWRSFGGHRYARVASRATRREQIRVAERVLREQGWDAWPACSARLGLA